jgi:hypothetical protein
LTTPGFLRFFAGGVRLKAIRPLSAETRRPPEDKSDVDVAAHGSAGDYFPEDS